MSSIQELKPEATDLILAVREKCVFRYLVGGVCGITKHDGQLAREKKISNCMT